MPGFAATDYCFHVPVDWIYIMHGPTMACCTKLVQQLETARSVEQDFTMKTPAARDLFRRKVELLEFTHIRDDFFGFKAIFQGREVSGNYSANDGQGRFRKG